MKSTPKILRARHLRRQMSDAEKILWFHLKNRHFQSYKFRRQYSIGPYYIDFYCSQLRLGIEVDGGQHYTATGQQYDRIRELYIKGKSITLIRYTNLDIIKNTKMVMADLLLRIRALNSSPYPLLKEERDCCGSNSIYTSSFETDKRPTKNTENKENP